MSTPLLKTHQCLLTSFIVKALTVICQALQDLVSQHIPHLSAYHFNCSCLWDALMFLEPAREAFASRPLPLYLLSHCLEHFFPWRATCLAPSLSTDHLLNEFFRDYSIKIISIPRPPHWCFLWSPVVLLS